MGGQANADVDSLCCILRATRRSVARACRDARAARAEQRTWAATCKWIRKSAMERYHCVGYARGVAHGLAGAAQHEYSSLFSSACPSRGISGSSKGSSTWVFERILAELSSSRSIDTTRWRRWPFRAQGSRRAAELPPAIGSRRKPLVARTAASASSDGSGDGRPTTAHASSAHNVGSTPKAAGTEPAWDLLLPASSHTNATQFATRTCCGPLTAIALAVASPRAAR